MKKIGIIAVIAIVIISVYSLSGNKEDSQEYIQNVQEERDEKNETLSTSSDSPFAKYGTDKIELKYFPIDEQYRVRAKIEKFTKRQYITLGSSDGKPVKYLKYAYASFNLQDTPLKLLILKNTEKSDNGLFTAFADDTSGKETYGGGRYLDLDFKNAQRITIDFNQAYSPYCNYNEDYSCPLPPAENILPIKIEAGEKDYKL